MKHTAWLAAGAATVIVVLTGAAFWLSYEHLHDVANGNGLNGARAWTWPATLDLFIIAGELLMLRASLQGRIDWWAIGLTVGGSGGSIALNVAGVGADAQPMEYIVAAVPPTAALVAFGALMRQVHDALQRTRAAAPAPAVESVEFERAADQAVKVADPDTQRAFVLDLAPQPPRLHPDIAHRPTAPALPAGHTPDAPEPQPTAAAPVVRDMPTAADDAQLLAAAAALNAAALAETGRPASLRTLQTGLRIGQRRAQRIQAQLPRSA